MILHSHTRRTCVQVNKARRVTSRDCRAHPQTRPPPAPLQCPWPTPHTGFPFWMSRSVTKSKFITSTNNPRFNFESIVGTSFNLKLIDCCLDQCNVCYDADEQVKFQVDKCQHAPHRKLALQSCLIANEPTLWFSNPPNCQQAAPPPS